ncbi:MAG: hypothetical protein HRU26_05625 [Psychroserpens sp.]|nr:hypothetical protein [Psychroserpens sp.]
MAVDLNAYGNCTTDFTGSGVGTCDITEFGDAKGITLFKKGTSYAITNGNAAFGLTEYTNEVKGLNAFPYVGIYDFAQDTPENEKNTSSTGVLTEIRSGKPQFSFMFTKGGCFHKSLYNKRGNALWDFGILFETGILLATNAAGDALKGFDGGMLSVETFKLLQGTDPQMSTAITQLLDAEEFNARHVFIPFSKVGDLDAVVGAIETQITVDAISAGTSFSASIVSACNTDNVILDLTDDTKYVLLGTQASATTISAVTYNASTNKYDFTVSPALVASDTVQIKLGDGTYDVIEDTTGNLYKGTSNSVTVS